MNLMNTIQSIHSNIRKHTCAKRNVTLTNFYNSYKAF